MASIRASESWSRVSPRYQALIKQTVEGKSPNVQFAFKGLQLPRGVVDHPPNTDRLEVRNSLTVEFLGTARGNMLAHLFNDGTIKTREQMHATNNERAAEEARLTAEESRFPTLGQTAARTEAYAKMYAKIQAARADNTKSIMAKQIEKSNAQMEYQNFLQAQAHARAALIAAHGARREGGH